MTKIIVFGAGGRVGPVLVEEAVSRAHDVTAVLRSPRPPYPIEGARIAEGDVSDASSVATLAAGHDVVVSAIGNTREGVPRSYPADISPTPLTGPPEPGIATLLT